MDWKTEYIKREFDWVDITQFFFGSERSHTVNVDIHCKLSADNSGAEYKIYEIRSGFCFDNVPDFDVNGLMYAINLNTLIKFSEHKGETQPSWWCAQFKKDDLEQALELALELKEYMEYAFENAIPDFLK